MVKSKTKSISNLGTFSNFLKLNVQSIIFSKFPHEIEAAAICFSMERGRRKSQQNSRWNWFMQYKTCLTHPKNWMIGRSKEFEDDRSDSASRVLVAVRHETKLGSFKRRLKKIDVTQLCWSVNSFNIIITKLYINLSYFTADIFSYFYIVDRSFIMYLFSVFRYFCLWQYLQNSDTCNTVMS